MIFGLVTRKEFKKYKDDNFSNLESLKVFGGWRTPPRLRQEII